MYFGSRCRNRRALAEELGSEHFALELDVRFEAAVEQAAADVYARWEAVDVLVNNAGSELNKTYNKTTVEEWDKVLDTDLKGPWLLCKHSCRLWWSAARAA